MSAERRWDQRGLFLEESITQNNGARTIFIEHMTQGTAVPPHYHNRFSETFDLISGSMKVYQSSPDSSKSIEEALSALEASPQSLSIGTKVTIQPGVYHKYVAGSESTVLRVIVEPGNSDWERLMMIMNGLREDGRLDGLSDSMELNAVIMDLADAHVLGDAGKMMEKVRRNKGEEISNLRKELLDKYENEEQLRRLLNRGR